MTPWFVGDKGDNHKKKAVFIYMLGKGMRLRANPPCL